MFYCYNIFMSANHKIYKLPPNQVQALEQLEPAEQNIISNLKQILKIFTIKKKKTKTEFNITNTQINTLNFIIKNENATVIDLAELMQLSSSSLISILNKLENLGLIERQRSKFDRRKVKTKATDKGFELSQSAPMSFEQNIINELHELGKTQLKTLDSGVNQLLNIVQKTSIEIEEDSRSNVKNKKGENHE